MAMDVVLVAGTKKGVFLLRSDAGRRDWRLMGPYLKGVDVNHAVIDPRSGRLFATNNDPWFGNRISCSDDLGETWQDNELPPKFAEGSGNAVEKLWRVEPGLTSQPGVLWCGLGPAALFQSHDNGLTWQENNGLSTHPTRHLWNPGNGGLIAHSIVINRRNPDRVWVAISAAGVLRSDDGGASWQVKNHNLRDVMAKYDPQAQMYPEVGQCVHHLVHAAGNGDRLYAQSHWGTYRSDDGGDHWTEITEGLPSDFGLVMAAHPHDPDTAYVLPLEGGEFRCPPEGRLRVYRTRDAGKTWQALTEGLPQDSAFMGTYREAMCTDSFDPAGIYFGTNTGQVYVSADEGGHWRRICSDLPPVSSLTTHLQ